MADKGILSNLQINKTALPSIPVPVKTPDSQIVSVQQPKTVSTNTFVGKNDKPDDFWGQLATGGYAALNSAALGIPDFLVKTANSDAYNAILENRAKNKDAATYGDIVGTVGGMFIPGGALLKGAQLGAKAAGAAGAATKLAKAVDYVSGAKKVEGLGAKALQGATQAAATAVPTALTKAATSEEPLDAQSVLAQVGVGAVANPVVGKVGKLLGRWAPEAVEKGEEALLKNVGVTGKSWNKALFGAENLENLPEQLTGATRGEIQTALAPVIKTAAAKTLRDNKATTGMGFKEFAESPTELELTKRVLASNPDLAPELAAKTATLLKSAAGQQVIGAAKESGGELTKFLSNPLTLLSLAGGAVGYGTSPDEDKLKNTLLAAGGTYALSRGVPKLLSAGGKLGEKAAPVIENSTQLAAQGGAAATKAVQSLNTDPTEATLLSPQAETEKKDKLVQQANYIDQSEAQEETPVTMENPVYQQAVINRLKEIYTTERFDQYDDFETFVRNVGARTNNFDPKYMGKVFYLDPSMQAKYEKDVQLGQQLKKLPVDELIKDSANPWADLPGVNLVNKDVAAKQVQKQQFEALLNGGKPMAEKDAQALKQTLANISRLPAGKQREAFKDLLKSNYNIDITELERLGVL